MVPIIRATVSGDGVLSFQADQRQSLTRWLKTLTHQPVEVIVRRAKSQRSLDQNAYLHAVPFPMVAEFMGEDIEGAKLFLMGECWGWKQVNGRDVPMRPHTSDMSVEDCRYFIDWLIPWAVEHCDGMQIPLPNEAEAS